MNDRNHRNKGRKIAAKLYPVGPCFMCGKQGMDRHHKDGDTWNNTPENIEILCRKCHMIRDGRLQALTTAGTRFFKELAIVRRAFRIKICVVCGKEIVKGHPRNGECPQCYEFFRNIERKARREKGNTNE